MNTCPVEIIPVVGKLKLLKEMDFRRMGCTGLKVPAFSFGTWVTAGLQVEEDTVIACIQEAFAGGVRMFDTAEVYAEGKAEIVMGKALKTLDCKRSDIVVSTKIFWGGEGPNDVGLSRKHIVEGAQACLERLQLSYVDILFCHRPDVDCPIEETVRAMNYLINNGLIFYWGTSEWSAAQILEAITIADRIKMVGPCVEQCEYNMFKRERMEKEYLPLFQKGMGTTIWSPLASGILTGKYNAGIPEGSRLSDARFLWLRKLIFDGETAEQKIESVRKLEPIAKELECSLAQLALAWCLRNENVSTVILGASRPEQVKENLKALAVVPKLTTDIMKRIDEILGNAPVQVPNFREMMIKRKKESD